MATMADESGETQPNTAMTDCGTRIMDAMWVKRGYIANVKQHVVHLTLDLRSFGCQVQYYLLVYSIIITDKKTNKQQQSNITNLKLQLSIIIVNISADFFLES